MSPGGSVPVISNCRWPAPAASWPLVLPPARPHVTGLGSRPPLRVQLQRGPEAVKRKTHNGVLIYSHTRAQSLLMLITPTQSKMCFPAQSHGPGPEHAVDAQWNGKTHPRVANGGQNKWFSHIIRSFSCRDGPSPSDGKAYVSSFEAKHNDYEMEVVMITNANDLIEFYSLLCVVLYSKLNSSSVRGESKCALASVRRNVWMDGKMWLVIVCV